MNSSTIASNAAAAIAAAPANDDGVRAIRTPAAGTVFGPAPPQGGVTPFTDGAAANVQIAQPATAPAGRGSRTPAHSRTSGGADEPEHASPPFEPRDTQNGWRAPLYMSRGMLAQGE